MNRFITTSSYALLGKAFRLSYWPHGLTAARPILRSVRFGTSFQSLFRPGRINQ